MEFIKPRKHDERFKTIEDVYLFILNSSTEFGEKVTIENLEPVMDSVRENILKSYSKEAGKDLTTEQLELLENMYITYFNCGLFIIKNEQLYFYSPLHFQYINIQGNFLAVFYAKLLSLHWFN